MKRSSRSATNSAMKRAKERTVTKKPKGFLNAIGNGRHRFAGYTRTFERSLLIQAILIGAGIASFVVLIKTYNAFQEDREFRQEERKNWRLDRIDRAWNRVLRRATGNTAKGKALSYLFSQNVTLKRIDLSCKTMGGMENGECLRPVTITDLEISSILPLDKPGAYFGMSVMNKPSATIDFNGAIIDGFRMDNETARMNLNNAFVKSAKITKSVLHIQNKTNTNFSDANFDSSLIVTSGDISIQRSNISGVLFFETDGNKIRSGATNWFWADRPPLCMKIDTLLAHLGSRPLPCPFIFARRSFSNANTICSALTQSQMDRLKKKRLDKFPDFIRFFFESQESRLCSTGTRSHLGFGNKRHIRMLTIREAAFLYPQIYYGRRYPHP